VSRLTLADLEVEFKRRKSLEALRTKLKARKITHDQVATAAGVGRTLVVHVLAGRAKSQNVLDTVKRLLAQSPVEVAS